MSGARVRAGRARQRGGALLALIPLALALLAWPGAVGAADIAVNFQAEPRRGEVPLTVQFTNASDLARPGLAFHWDFGDGATSAEIHPSHTYTSPGTFTVTLAAGDGAGNAGAKESRDLVMVDGPTLVAAVLPGSRSVVVGQAATAFMSVINAGAVTATAVRVALDPATGPGGGPLPAALGFQTTDPSTNLVTGAPNAPVDILPGQGQSFVISLTPSGAFPPTETRFSVRGSNGTRDARRVSGVNTLLLAASPAPTPDVVAMAMTLSGDGVLRLGGDSPAGAFSVATSNVGAAGSITASVDTGTAVLPVSLSICSTDAASGQCVTAAAASVDVPMGPGTTATFAVFAAASAPVPYDPEVNRVFVTFAEGGATRGATSVAIRTE